ncbi:hypothetical protein EV144_102352 [Flavobacterium sp. 270]|nr:hypothetical protein EV144_102352 [Flavobacterium sp. 270]
MSKFIAFTFENYTYKVLETLQEKLNLYHLYGLVFTTKSVIFVTTHKINYEKNIFTNGSHNRRNFICTK